MGAPKRLKMLDQAEENSEKESENNEMYRHLDDSDLEYNETMMDAANEEQLQEQKNKEKKQDSNEDENASKPVDEKDPLGDEEEQKEGANDDMQQSNKKFKADDKNK